MPFTLRRSCRCSHEKAAHEHYRRGSDCAQCGCDRYRFGFVLTVALGTPVPAVISPDVVHEVAGPYVKPNHANLRTPGAAGLPVNAPAVPPLPRTEAEPDEATPRAAEL